MATERRQKVLLGLLVVVVLVGAIYWLWPAPSATPSSSSNRQAVATRGTGRAEQAASAQGTPGTPDVHLEALEAEKPKPTRRGAGRKSQHPPGRIEICSGTSQGRRPHHRRHRRKGPNRW